MKKINGQIVPENLPLSELEKRMDSSDMQTFAVTCEALRLANTRQAYEVLKGHISDSNPYKRRCILAVIFDYPEASELVLHLENALQSEVPFLVRTALEVVIQGKAHESDEQVLRCMERNLRNLDNRYYCHALRTVEKSESNAQRILKMYRTCKEDSIRIGLAECLHTFCTSENYMRFYDLFRDDSVPHIRIIACRIAKENQRPDLLQKFKQDKDGHIRKLVPAD